jgi:hypothetical protein
VDFLSEMFVLKLIVSSLRIALFRRRLFQVADLVLVNTNQSFILVVLTATAVEGHCTISC